MKLVAVEELIGAGVHFGHPASSWNPKMEDFIYGKRNLIHIINVRETVKGILRSYHFLKKLTGSGKEVLLVGTKRPAKQIVKETAENLEIPYVSERWLGGMLTNFSTIRERLKRLEEIENMEETGMIDTFSKKMISSLLREKRKIKRNLEGVRHMTKLPSALVIIDPKREYIAVREAYKLDLPVVAVIDTDSDPDLIDIPIPGNDDAYRSIAIIVKKLAQAIEEGKKDWTSQKALLKKAEAERKAKEAEAAKKRAEAKKAGKKETKPAPKKEAKSSKKAAPKKEDDSKDDKKSDAKAAKKEAPKKEAKAEKAAAEKKSDK